MKGLFNSLRDKNGSPSRSKSQNREDKGKEKEKIDEVQKILENLEIANISNDHIRDVLAAPYADGDPIKAVEVIDIEHKSEAGIITPYDPSVHMVGAVNRNFTTCYLDTLLFAMFAKLDSFECMIRHEFPPEDPRSRLVHVLRVYINMMRSGKLIHTDLTKLLQDCLAECGWPEAQLTQQQDTSEAFAFLTEKLELPLLSLQVDLFHQGKSEADDHKIVYERLLNIAVPPDPEGKGLRLEDCLEEYFNAQIDVSRDSEVKGKSIPEKTISDSVSTPIRRSNGKQPAGYNGDASGDWIVSSPIQMTPLSPRDSPATTGSVLSGGTTLDDLNRSNTHDGATSFSSRNRGSPPSTSSSHQSLGSQRQRQRSTSLIQRIRLDEKGRPSARQNITIEEKEEKAAENGSTVVKAVTIPAWQFFRLIPWHALKNREPRTNLEVARTLDQKPIVGICLKRYGMTESGVPQRINTYIDIPDSLRLPYFMLASGPEMEEDQQGLNQEYKLVLQSVICHRGDSLQSGHYIAFARVAPKLLVDNRRHDFDPPPDYEEAQWARFDDMVISDRVSFVSDINQALRSEMPYLLFYQIVHRHTMTVCSGSGGEPEPPSYSESRNSIDAQYLGSSDSYPTTPSLGPKASLEDPAIKDIPSLLRARGHSPSIRLSTDCEFPSRKLQDGYTNGYHNHDAAVAAGMAASRRQSVSFSDSAQSAATPILTPEGQSPIFAPEDEPSTASRLSRAASRFTLMQSRAVSSSSDSRLSNTMSRLGFYKTSREALAELNGSSSHRISTSESAAYDPAGRKSTSSELVLDDRDKSQDSALLTPTPKTKHKRTKSKDKDKDKDRDRDKGDKSKFADSNDRECILM